MVSHSVNTASNKSTFAFRCSVNYFFLDVQYWQNIKEVIIIQASRLSAILNRGLSKKTIRQDAVFLQSMPIIGSVFSVSMSVTSSNTFIQTKHRSARNNTSMTTLLFILDTCFLTFWPNNDNQILYQSNSKNTTPTQHNRAMRRPLIRLVDDVTLVRNAEIKKLKG